MKSFPIGFTGIPTRLLKLAAVLGIFGGLALACGEKRPKPKTSSPHVGPVEHAFNLASASTGIPVRYLMAVGYLESRLVAAQASSLYVNPEDPSQKISRGTNLTETAFGLPKETLGLDPVDPASSELSTQIAAYAEWINTNSTELNLNPAPIDPNDKYVWISHLAAKHREGRTQRRNVRILFARELIEVLNEGFLWQDPVTGERINLPKENPPVRTEDLRRDGQQWFELDDRPADIGTAVYYPLVSVPSNGNEPKRIEIIHCPLSLSACLELHALPKGDDVRMGAHYVIPPNRNIIQLPMQVARHSHVVSITNSKGEEIPIQDAIVVMLVGNSGRLVDGVRKPALPTWFSDTQLRDMGNVVNDVCAVLAQEGRVDYETCLKVGEDGGVRFRYRGQREPQRWGEIADFDPTIFPAYVERPGAVESGVAFEFAGDRRTYASSEIIPLKVLFQPLANSVALERLARCMADGRVIWETIDVDYVRGQTSTTFNERFFDAGPNGNGDQFFRVRVYDANDELVGWSIDQVFMSGFDKEKVATASPKNCASWE